MKAGNYSMKAVADPSSKSCYERERLREREREARAQMTYEADQRVSQDMMNSAPLFGEIVRVNPKSNDKERQQIERKLGRFEDVKHLLADQDVTNLFGVDGQPPPSPAPNISSSSSSIVGHEFKKPNACLQSHQTKSSSHHHHHHHHHHSSSAQRNSFTKPSGEPKLSHSNRSNFYAAGSSAKHGNLMSTNNVSSTFLIKSGGGNMAANSSVSGGGNSNAVSAANYHYGGVVASKNSSSSSHDYASRIQHSVAKNLPKLNCEVRDSLRGLDSSDDNASISQTNVENILDEMTSGVRIPLTAIAATPRKEVESKFTFNPISGKVESLLPLPRTSVDKSSKINTANNALGPAISRGSFVSSSSIFRNDEVMNVLQPFSSTTALPSVASSNTVARNGGYAYSTSTGQVALSSANKERIDSTAVLPNLKSDLSLSEDTDDGDGDGAENDNDEDDNDCDDEDDDEEDDDDDDEDEKHRIRRRRQHLKSANATDEKDCNKYKTAAVAGSAFTCKKESSSSTPPKMDDLRKDEAGTTSEMRNSSSSDDSDSDSGSESEDSSSDSPSPPSLPLPVVTEQEESKHRWNLKNFLPPSAHGNSAPPSTHNSQQQQQQQTNRRENCEKLKTDDSDSSNGSARVKSRPSSCSTSDSDNDSVRLRASSRKSTIDNAKANSNVGVVKNSGGAGVPSISGTADGGGGSGSSRRKYRLRSSSYSQSSDDDSDRALPYVASNSVRNNGISIAGGNGSNNSNVSNSISVVGGGSGCSTSASGANVVVSSSAAGSLNSTSSFASNGGGGGATGSVGCCGGGGKVGVVRPHQRKPPSPQIFHHNGRNRNATGLRDLSPSTNGERFATFAPQRSLHSSNASGGNAAPEPQCDLSASHSENSIVLKNVNRSLINDHYQQALNSGHANSITKVGNSSKLSGKASCTVAATAMSSNVDNNGAKVGALVSNDKSSLLPSNKTVNISSKVRRKSKSPALAASNESPIKKKRGRKRTVKVPDLTESDDDTLKVKAVPEKKRPGRPPLKRNDTSAATAEDVDWNSSSRRKMADKFPSSAANVWCDRERRRSSLRMSSFTTVDSDSEIEFPTATVKPTARIIPAVKRKEGGGGGGSVRIKRDSSCESMRNDNDFNAVSDGIKGASVGGGGSLAKAQESPPKLDVECIAVQDKKKSDTLRKLFSRREEGGGKSGGKGKGGKGKCGVIVMESEVERKLLQRSSVVSPTSLASPPPLSSSSLNLPKIQDHIPDVARVAISSPGLTPNGGSSGGSGNNVDDRYSEISYIPSSAADSGCASTKTVNNDLISNNSSSGGGGGSSGANNSHHYHHHHHHHHHHHPNSGGSGNSSNEIGGVERIPKLTYNEAGKPSLMCKIDLSKIPYILAKKRSEEIRIKSELSDTRQSSTNATLDAGGVVSNTCAAGMSAMNMGNVPMIEPISDRRRNSDYAASINSITTTATSNPTSVLSSATCVMNTDTAPAAAVIEQNDPHRERNKQHARLTSPLPTSHSRKKHSSKKTKSTKRKRYANEPEATSASSSQPTTTGQVAEEEDLVSIFATTTSAVHTPSVDTTDMDSSLSSDSETRKHAATNLARSNNKNKKMSTTSAPLDSAVHGNLSTSCYPMNLSDVKHPIVNSVVDAPSSADDESWNSSDSSSCSNCSASSTSCHGAGDKFSAKMGKRSSQCRGSGCGKKKKKKPRNEHSQRHSASVEGGSGSGAGGGSAMNLMHLPNSGSSHDRNTINEPAPTFNGYHQVAINDLVRPTVLTHHGIYYSYLEHKASEEINSESDNVSPNLYLMEAKRLKHAADMERDLVAQGMQYLEAILSFVLTGHVLERKNQMDTAFNMYSETLKLIVYISKKFRTLCTNVTPSSIPNKIAILSLRCESILNLKLYTMRENEVKDVHNAVAEYFNKSVTVEPCLISNPASVPSPHSPTPSPASSDRSNSSGYSSGDPRSVSQCVAVPLNLHIALQKQHNFYSNLIASFSYWEEADKLIFSGGNKDFFIELDRFCGPLTLHSSLKDLVHYVRVGIQRLKAIISHNHGV